MAAPKGNQFWKLRSKHGRNALFNSPELLIASAYEYFDWCDKHTWHKPEAVKSGAECGRIIEVPIKRPYSISGLCVYLGCNPSYLHNFKKRCNDEFREAIEHIETIVETQQFEGAVIGAFNTSIIARKLGLRENIDLSANEDVTFKIEVIDENTRKQLENLKQKLG